MRTPTGRKKVPFIKRCPYARVVLGATKSVPFREVSSIQGCPYRGVIMVYGTLYFTHTHARTHAHTHKRERTFASWIRTYMYTHFRSAAGHADSADNWNHGQHMATAGPGPQVCVCVFMFAVRV